MSKFFQNMKNIIGNIIPKKNGYASEKECFDNFDEKLTNLYNNFFLRISVENWNQIVKEQLSIKSDTETLSNELLKFIMDNPNLPYEVWCLLDETFKWSKRSEQLYERFPDDFVRFALSNINNEYPLRFNFFKEEINGTYDDFIDSYYDGYFALNKKNLYAAQKSIDKAKEIFSEHLDLIYLEAQYYFEIHDIKKALEKLSYVINNDSESLTAYLNRGVIYVRSGELEKAYEDYHKYLSCNPDNLGAMYELANCSFNLGKYEEARSIYKNLLVEYSNHKELLSNFNSVNHFLIDKLEKKITTNDYNYSDKFSLAESYFHFKEYEKCLNLIENIETLIEPTFKLYLLLGDTYRHLDKIDKAVHYYDKALNLDPNNWQVYYSKGLLLNDLNKNEEALEYFNTAINLKSNYYRLYLNKALSLKLLKRYKEALEYIDKALELSEDDPEAYYIKGVILHILENYKDALSNYKTCYETSYELYEKAVYNAALALYKLENYEDAYKFFNSVLEADDKFFLAYGGKLLVLNKVEDYDECINVCASALRNHDKNIDHCSSEMIINQFKEILMTNNSHLDVENNYEEICEVVDKLYDYMKRRC